MTDQLPIPVTAPFTRAQRAMLVNLITRAVRAEILPRFRKLDSGQIGTKSGPNDLVTEATPAQRRSSRAACKSRSHMP